MGERRVLAAGQWLGTGNRISRLAYSRCDGWVAVDSTDATYRQRFMPDGLATADTPEAEKVRTPWPALPTTLGEQ